MSGFGIEMKTQMNSRLDGIGVGRLSESSHTEKAKESEGGGFGETLKKMMADANESQLEADTKVQELVAGRNKDIHGTMLAMEKADVNFRLLTQVRNKVIEAYREIMRMQV